MVFACFENRKLYHTGTETNKNQGLAEALRSLSCIDKLQLTEQTSVATTYHPSEQKILVLTPGLQRTKFAQKFIFARMDYDV